MPFETTEQNFESIFNKEIQNGEFEKSERLTPERKKELEVEIGDTAKIFNGIGRPWFIAGGIALELNSGSLSRDHQDIDIAVFYEDLPRYFEYCTSREYEFFEANGKQIESVEKLMAQEANCFVTKVDENIPGLSGFEIIFLRKNSAGNVVFGYNNVLDFPRALYENAPHHTIQNGETVPYTPPDIQLLYKISDGRMGDFDDLKTFLHTLKEVERARLDSYLDTLGIAFEIREKETRDLSELIRLVEEDAPQFRHTLEEKVRMIIKENVKHFNDSLQKIYDIAMSLPSPKKFLNELENEFGEKATKWSVQELDKATAILFREPRPLFTEFRNAFPIENSLMKKVRQETRTLERFRTKTHNPNDIL